MPKKRSGIKRGRRKARGSKDAVVASSHDLRDPVVEEFVRMSQQTMDTIDRLSTENDAQGGIDHAYVPLLRKELGKMGMTNEEMDAVFSYLIDQGELHIVEADRSTYKTQKEYDETYRSPISGRRYGHFSRPWDGVVRRR